MRWTFSLTITFAILILAACGPRRAEVEPPRPTITPVPTYTSTPVGAAGAVSSGQVSQPAQAQPAATSAPPTAIPTPQPMANVGTLMNVRSGPGLNYPVIGTANPGQQFPITGKNPGLGDWWEIEYTETLRAWVYGPLVNASNVSGVGLAQFIPAPPPPPTATPIPPPTPAPTQRVAPRFKYSLVNSGNCTRHEKISFFNGIVRDKNNNPTNEVCLHIAFHGPRNTKCSGCGVETGRWGFTPFGQQTGAGQPVEIYVVNCPSGVPRDKGLSGAATGSLTPISDKWFKHLTEGTTCSDITFKEN